MEEHALAFLHAHGFALSQLRSVDRVVLVGDVPAILRLLGRRNLHVRIFAVLGHQAPPLHVAFLVFLHFFRIVDFGDDVWFPLVRREKHFLIVGARIPAWFYVDEGMLSAEHAAREIVACGRLAVKPPRARRLRRENLPDVAMRGHGGAALLGGAIEIQGNVETVPVDVLRPIEQVVDIDGRRFALAQMQHGAGNRSVVGGSADKAPLGDFDEQRRKKQRVSAS